MLNKMCVSPSTARLPLKFTIIIIIVGLWLQTCQIDSLLNLGFMLLQLLTLIRTGSSPHREAITPGFIAEMPMTMMALRGTVHVLDSCEAELLSNDEITYWLPMLTSIC